MIRAFCLLLACAVAAASAAPNADEESAVTLAALSSYFNLTHGGTAVAFPERRRPVLLHDETIAPSREQLRARVASPANRAAREQYSSRDVQRLIARVVTRSAKPRSLPFAPSGYALSNARPSSCGPEYDDAKFVDAVAVSRVAFEGRSRALLYLEHSGGARAYHLMRRGGRWEVDWYVELWACG